MVFRSQVLKHNIYPECFTEDDKILFDKLFEESKIYHPKEHESDPWLIRYAIICYINGINGRGQDIKKEDVDKLRKSYELKSRIFETPQSDDYKDPEKFLINLPDDELNKILEIQKLQDEKFKSEDLEVKKIDNDIIKLNENLTFFNSNHLIDNEPFKLYGK